MLPLTSGVEIFLGCTIFEFGFFCLLELPYIWNKEQKILQNEFYQKNDQKSKRVYPRKVSIPEVRGGKIFFFLLVFFSIFGDKKIQTQKWCIVEKFRPQKLGVTKGFFILKVVSDFDFDHFLEK